MSLLRILKVEVSLLTNTETESESKNVESQSEKSKSDEETDSFQQSERSKKSSDQETQEENIQNQPSNETLEQKQYSPVEELENRNETCTKVTEVQEQYSNENVDLDLDLDLPSIEIRPKKNDFYSCNENALDSEAIPVSVNEMEHVVQKDQIEPRPVSVNEMDHVVQKDQIDQIESRPASVNEMDHVVQKDKSEAIPASVNEMDHVVQKDQSEAIPDHETQQSIPGMEHVQNNTTEAIVQSQSEQKENENVQNEAYLDDTLEYEVPKNDVNNKEVTQHLKQEVKIDVNEVKHEEQMKDVVKKEREKTEKKHKVTEQATEININVECQGDGNVTEEYPKKGKVLSKRRQKMSTNSKKKTDSEAEDKNLIPKDSNDFIPTFLDESVLDVSAMASNAIEYFIRGKF